MDATKDVEINGVRYQIGRMTAKAGSWVATQIFTKVLPSAIEGQMNKLGLDSLPQGRATMTEEEFSNLQDHCLMVCRRYELVGNIDTALPIMPRPGFWAIKELEYDLLTVVALTVHALVFNISPFFDGDALKGCLQSFQGLGLFNAST